MALVGMAFGIGFTFGPLIGYLARELLPGWRSGPGFLAAGLSLLALGLGLVLLTETWRPGAQAGHRRWLDRHGLQVALRTPVVGVLVLGFFLATFAFANFEATLALLTRDLLGYSEADNFLVFAYIGFTLMLVQGGFYQVLARRGVREISFILFGTTCMGLGMAGLAGLGGAVAAGQAPSGVSLLLLFLGILTITVVGFACLTPSVQALISRRSARERQGEILGVNQSAAALARILGPVVGLSLYSLPPAHVWPYGGAAVLLTLVLLLLGRERHA